jgi:hypothetical protein
MPRSLVSQAGPLAMRRVLAADAPNLKRSLTLDLGTMHYFSYRGCFLEQHDTGRFPTHLTASSNTVLGTE